MVCQADFVAEAFGLEKKTFAPGFRLSAIDVLILVAGGIGGAACLLVDFRLAIGVWYVVVHFFLFCNVLRMTRLLEFIWAGIFISLAVASVQLALFSWPLGLGCSLSTTVLLAAIEVRMSSYHGVGWQKLNPRLPEWWQARQVSGDHK